MSAARRVLLVFLKAPVPGRVKTRLAAGIGERAAARAHAAMAKATLKVTRRLRAVETVWVYDPAPGFPNLRWLGPVGRTWRQAKGDLGTRLTAAFARAFREGANRVCAIGTDSPELSAEQVSVAFRALESCDSAIIPADDGGYCLLGLSRAEPGLFENIPWSGPRVLAATSARAKALGLRLSRSAPSCDVDSPADLVRWLLPPMALPLPRSGRGRG